jgi:hypothetical protein
LARGGKKSPSATAFPHALDLTAQLDALKAAGAETIYREKVNKRGTLSFGFLLTKKNAPAASVKPPTPSSAERRARVLADLRRGV